MIKPSDLIALFQYALDNHWGYIWGAYGQTWTAAKQKAATREMTVKYGSKWIGHRVADCSGLVYWAIKLLGGTTYHGSHTMFTRWTTARGDLKNGKRTDGGVLLPGTAVFKKQKASSGQKSYNGYNYHHVGLYIGNGTVIEAKGTINGVVTSKVESWHAWGELKGVDYSGGENSESSGTGVSGAPVQPSTADNATVSPTRLLKRTSPMQRGDDVKALQEQLTTLGFACGKIDGIFGDKTKAAVIAFQTASGVTVDGIVGPVTSMKLAEKLSAIATTFGIQSAGANN